MSSDADDILAIPGFRQLLKETVYGTMFDDFHENAEVTRRGRPRARQTDYAAVDRQIMDGLNP